MEQRNRGGAVLLVSEDLDGQPAGVAWEEVRQDQSETIPFLARLRRKIEAGKQQT